MDLKPAWLIHILSFFFKLLKKTLDMTKGFEVLRFVM